MNVTFKILRFNPEKDKRPHFEEYPLDMEPGDSVLNGLLHIKTFVDGTLGFRKSCGHGICGSDAMIINDEERLACKTLIRDLGMDVNAVVTIEPLKALPVQRDLLVDQDRFFNAYKAVKPFLINDNPAGDKERLQSQADRDVLDDPSKCILCASCYSACPITREKNPSFIGPAAIVNAARFILDTRDKGFEDRLHVLNHQNGVWPCENHFRCTQVCPRGIKVTKNINAMKAKIRKHTQET
jgi:succinate dehydrogenase / fumarate reductase, iron-sulfur subunit